MKLSHLISLGIVAGALTGCAGGLPPDVATHVENFSRGVEQTDVEVRKLYAFALTLCELAPTKADADACASTLRDKSKLVREGFGYIRAAYCAIKPEEPACAEDEGDAR